MSDEPARANADAATKKKRRRRRGGKPRPEAGAVREPPTGPPAEASAREGAAEVAARALGAIDRLVKLAMRDLGVPEGGDEAQAVLPLALELGRGADRSLTARAEALVREVRERVGAATLGATAFREGHVYCFHTNQPESPYSQPPHASHVFAGYGATGKPEWVSFANLLLARREPRVDRLYGESAEVLAIAQGPGELDAGLLPEFGRHSLTYRLLGQVVLGLVPKDLDPRSRAERVALSLQIVETSQPGMRHRLRLNVIGLSPEAIAAAAADQAASSSAEAFRKVLRATRARVDSLGRRAALAHKRGETFDLTPHIELALGRLRGDVLRVLKSRDYRTRHAEERHQSGERPTALAVADALSAGDGRFFRDEHKDTIVVLGPKHRVHVFSSTGRHVTSLELQPAEIERRVDLARWRLLERHKSELFKQTLEKSLNPDAFAEAAVPVAPPGPRS